MKRIFSLLFITAILALGFAMPARAQFSGGTYGVVQLGWFATNVTASVATNYNLPPSTNLPTATAIGPLYNWKSITFVLSVQATAAAGNTTVAFVRSIDGVNWETTPFMTLTSTNLVASNNVVLTNVYLDATGYICPLYVTNSAASANVTNIFLKYSLKPGF